MGTSSSSRAATRRLVTAAAVAFLLLVGGTATAFGAYPPGVDTSHYQHRPSLNWSAVKGRGVAFAYLKATEGSGWTDPYFRADWAATARAGLLRGAYHFARPAAGNAGVQARHFARVIGPQRRPGTLPPVLDLESTGGLSPKKLVAWTHTWLSTVARLTGRNPMIYVSPLFWKEHLRNDRGFHAYPLWVANYGVSRPMVPGGWPRWSFWQSTSSGRIAGIRGRVDRDVFNGTMTQLRRFALLSTRPPAPRATALTLRAANPAPLSGQTDLLSGTLHDAAGKPLAGRALTLSSRPVGSPTWSTVARATTSRTGAFAVRAVVTSAADYRVAFAGSTGLRPAASPVVRVDLTPIPTSLSLSSAAAETLAGSAVTLSGALSSTPRRSLAGVPVTVSRQLAGSTRWTTLGRATTDETGLFSLTTTMLRSATYRAEYAGGPAYTAAVSPPQAVTVLLNPSAVSLVVARTAPYRGQTVRIDGTLIDGDAPVAGRTVVVSRQLAGSSTWSTVTSVTTDAAGHFATSAVVDQPATYRAVFAGDVLYATSTSAGTAVTITPPEPTTLTTVGRSVRRRHAGDAVLLGGRLTSDAGAALTGHRVSVWSRLPGSSTWHRVASTVTDDSRGSWRVSVRPQHTCALRAVFAGSSRWAAARSEAVRVLVR